MKPSELNARIRNPVSKEDQEAARKEKAVIINRVGEKIRRLRPVLPEQGYIEFRNHLYSIPEDDREAAVDKLLAKHGMS